jgi:hypothetical protein
LRDTSGDSAAPPALRSPNKNANISGLYEP